MVWWFSSFWYHFDFVKLVKFEVSGHILEKPSEEWPGIWHADVSWLPSELIRFWSQSVDFSHFATTLTDWKRWNLMFSGIFLITHDRSGLKIISCYYTLASAKLKRVYTGFTLSICPSVYLSVRLWTESCLLCIFHNTSRVHFVWLSNVRMIKYHLLIDFSGCISPS